MKKIIVISVLAILISFPAMAATDDHTADADFDVADITFGSTVVDMTIKSGSTAEQWDVDDSGNFTVTNPGTFQVGCASSSVGAIIVKNGSTNVACAENTTPGTSFVTTPTSAATYTLVPSTITNCTSLCTSLSHAVTYNSFPTCGALTCDPGYSVSGSGSSATCASNGGPGGGGSSTNNTPPANGTTQTQTSSASSDGSGTNSTNSVTRVNGQVVQTSVQTTINLSPNPTEPQVTKLDSSLSSEVKEVDLLLPASVLKDLSATYSSSAIKTEIISRDANSIQNSTDARGGLFMVGSDIFSVNVTVGNNQIKNFSSAITLSFDISKITDRSNLEIYFFNTVTQKWEKADGGGVINGDMFTVSVDHLTDFAIMKKIETPTEKEIIPNRPLLDQVKQNDAIQIVKSDKKLNGFLLYLKLKRNSKAETQSMKVYTNKLIKGIKLSKNEINSVNNFIVYGAKVTLGFSMGKRISLLENYKNVFGKLPRTSLEWQDCLSMARGIKPTQKNAKAEAKSKIEFIKIYQRKPNLKNSHDMLALNYLAYGLFSPKIDLKAEAGAIKTFKAIYKHDPKANDWIIVRAIAYSGTKR